MSYSYSLVDAEQAGSDHAERVRKTNRIGVYSDCKWDDTCTLQEQEACLYLTMLVGNVVVSKGQREGEVGRAMWKGRRYCQHHREAVTASPSAWQRLAFLRLWNLWQHHHVAVPWAASIAAWRLSGSGHSSNDDDDGDGNRGSRQSNMRCRMAKAMRW